MSLTTSTSERNGVVVVHCSGQVDVASARVLRDAIRAQIPLGKLRVALDLTGVDFVDSTGLGVIVGGLKSLRREGGVLTIAASAERVRRIFEITGLDKVFVLHETADAAASAAAQTGA